MASTSMPPVDAVMPALAQTAMIVVFGVLVLLSLVHALRLIAVRRDHRLMVMLGCGAAAALLEGFACHLIRCYHSPVGIIEVYESFGIHVPLWLSLLYVLFFGAMPYHFLGSFARKPTAGTFWWAYALIAISEGVGEMVMIHLGTHSYWGVQPLPVFGFPLYLGAVNAACMMATALIAAHWFNAVKGMRRYALMALTPPLIAAVYSGLTFPTIALIHGEMRVPMVVGSFVTIVLSLLLAVFTRAHLPRFAAQWGAAR